MRRGYSPERRALARRLRREMTQHEARLWRELRLLKPQGLHFRRQVPLGRYIVDFACFSRSVVVEVDGGQHAEDAAAAQDAERDGWLASIGFLTLRFWNHEIDRGLGPAIDHVVATALSRPTHHAFGAVPPPHEGEG